MGEGSRLTSLPVRARRAFPSSAATRCPRRARRALDLVVGALTLGSLALLPAVASADRVVPKKGAAVRGTVTRTDTEVLVNKYRSRSAAMTFGVVRFPVAEVSRVEDESVPLDVVRRRLEDLKADDVAGRIGLAKYALSQKVEPEGRRLLEEALALAPGQVEALALYGGAERFAVARRGNPSLDPDLARELVAMLALPTPRARANEARRLEAARGFPARPEVVERMARSLFEPKGEREDVPLKFASDRIKGGLFTVFVPEGYVPYRPTPLVVGLHGGAAGGKSGDVVLGSGRDAGLMYLKGCQARGWILVCPTAIVAPWAAPPNDAYLLSVIEEVGARWNIDPDRVFLTGHASGGTGAWALGSRHTDQFAAVGPTGSMAPQGLKAFRAAKTALFVYHSADDPAAPLGPVQAFVDQALDQGQDIVYLRLEDQGHSFPGDAEAELFDVLRTRRLAGPARATAWPRSSFDRKPSADEIRVFGDASSAWDEGPAKAPPANPVPTPK